MRHESSRPRISRDYLLSVRKEAVLANLLPALAEMGPGLNLTRYTQIAQISRKAVYEIFGGAKELRDAVARYACLRTAEAAEALSFPEFCDWVREHPDEVGLVSRLHEFLPAAEVGEVYTRIGKGLGVEPVVVGGALVLVRGDLYQLGPAAAHAKEGEGLEEALAFLGLYIRG